MADQPTGRLADQPTGRLADQPTGRLADHLERASGRRAVCN
ncbi:hypothetical protein [Streptomyces massasporeus]